MNKKVLFAVALVAGLLASFGHASAFRLPDTGQAVCYDASGTVLPCAGTGQDGAYRINPISYTGNGNGTVTDYNTGLMWQKQTDNNTYNWYQAAGAYDVTYNSNSKDVCGELALGGHADWRLPTKKELLTIVDYSVSNPGPTIDPAHFPHTHASAHWTSTAYVHSPDYAWYVGFYDGSAYGNDYWEDFVTYVRCVRGGQSQASFSDNLNGTVTDSNTGLIWAQGEAGSMVWDAALSYCEGLDLVGRTDWRLPNIKELESLTDDMGYDIAIDTTFFSDAQASDYWSSTTRAQFPGYAWGVNFGFGYVGHLDKKSYSPYVRCVSGGFSHKPALGTLTPSSVTSTAGKGQTFTAVYSDEYGYRHLKTVDFLVSQTGAAVNSIWARYNQVTNKISLYDDAGAAFSASCTPGVAGVIRNSQGKINCGLTTVTGEGNNLTMRWRINPQAAFADPLTPKRLKMKAIDKGGARSGWVVKGSWTINP